MKIKYNLEMGYESARHQSKFRLGIENYAAKRTRAHNSDIARGLICLINYGSEETFKKLLNFFEYKNNFTMPINIKYRFVSAITHLPEFYNDKVIKFNYDFQAFFNVFIKSIVDFKIWGKNDKEVGKFIDKAIAYLFSKENIYKNYVFIIKNTIRFNELIQDSKAENQYSNAGFTFFEETGELYGANLHNGKGNKFKVSIEIKNKKFTKNVIKKLKNVKNIEDYIELHKNLNQNALNPNMEIPCPLCNPSLKKKGDLPKTCKNCSEAIFMLAKIKYLIDMANKDGQKIKELSNFKCNKEYNKIRQRVYENIKNGLKGDDFTKLYKKHIEPLIASYKGIVANENNFRDKEIKISKLENTVKTWKEANFTSES